MNTSKTDLLRAIRLPFLALVLSSSPVTGRPFRKGDTLRIRFKAAP